MTWATEYAKTAGLEYYAGSKLAGALGSVIGGVAGAGLGAGVGGLLGGAVGGLGLINGAAQTAVDAIPANDPASWNELGKAWDNAGTLTGAGAAAGAIGGGAMGAYALGHEPSHRHRRHF